MLGEIALHGQGGDAISGQQRRNIGIADHVGNTLGQTVEQCRLDDVDANEHTRQQRPRRCAIGVLATDAKHCTGHIHAERRP